MLIDTHAHMDMVDFEKDKDEVIQRALNNNVVNIVNIGIDRESSSKGIQLSEKYSVIYCTVGIHPHNADSSTPKELNELAVLASSSKVVGWGEIGLDFFKRYSSPQKQMELFEEQLKIAGELNLPIIIHSRNAHRETYEMLKKYSSSIKKGVIHCFSGDVELAMEYIKMGFYISIPGTVTYRNATKIQEVVREIPIEYLLIETDAPFLSPEPKRGKRNEPSFITYTAKKIAELRNQETSVIEDKTTQNAKELYSI